MMNIYRFTLNSFNTIKRINKRYNVCGYLVAFTSLPVAQSTHTEPLTKSENRSTSTPNHQMYTDVYKLKTLNFPLPLTCKNLISSYSPAHSPWFHLICSSSLNLGNHNRSANGFPNALWEPTSFSGYRFTFFEHSDGFSRRLKTGKKGVHGLNNNTRKIPLGSSFLTRQFHVDSNEKTKTRFSFPWILLILAVVEFEIRLSFSEIKIHFRKRKLGIAFDLSWYLCKVKCQIVVCVHSQKAPTVWAYAVVRVTCFGRWLCGIISLDNGFVVSVNM